MWMNRNIAITDINSKYVWGGDAITLDGSDMVWIDHVTVSALSAAQLLPQFRDDHAPNDIGY